MFGRIGRDCRFFGKTRRNRLLLPGAAVALCALLLAGAAKAAAAETETKAPLAPEACTPCETYIECSIPDFIPTAGKTKDAMEAFYGETGVQPYLYVTGEFQSDGWVDYEAANAFLPRKYERLFGDDEGHYLLMLIKDETGYFSGLDYVGSAAADVMDYEARDALVAFLTESAQSDEPDRALAKVFDGAKETVMTHTEEQGLYYDNGVYYDMNGREVFRNDAASYSAESPDSGYAFFFILPAFIFFVAMAVIRAVKKQDEKERAQTQLAAEVRAAAQQAARETRSALPLPKEAKYPITCPGCGATAYPNADGSCQYCGRAIYDSRAAYGRN